MLLRPSLRRNAGDNSTYPIERRNLPGERRGKDPGRDTKSPHSTTDIVDADPLAARELLRLLSCQDRTDFVLT
jgi:hypothetical protein